MRPVGELSKLLFDTSMPRIAGPTAATFNVKIGLQRGLDIFFNHAFEYPARVAENIR
jgi:hypothetical protein